MKVRCDSIGSVPGRADNTTECAACGAAQVHDIDNCVPCIWNKEARCLPVLNDSRLHIHSMSEEEIKTHGEKVDQDEDDDTIEEDFLP